MPTISLYESFESLSQFCKLFGYETKSVQNMPNHGVLTDADGNDTNETIHRLKFRDNAGGIYEHLQGWKQAFLDEQGYIAEWGSDCVQHTAEEADARWVFLAKMGQKWVFVGVFRTVPSQQIPAGLLMKDGARPVRLYERVQENYTAAPGVALRTKQAINELKKAAAEAAVPQHRFLHPLC